MPNLPKKSKYKYVGPYYEKGHILGKQLINPAKLSDEQIEALMKNHPFMKKWWKPVKS